MRTGGMLAGLAFCVGLAAQPAPPRDISPWQLAMERLQIDNRPLSAVTQMAMLADRGELPPTLLAQFWLMTGDDQGVGRLLSALPPVNHAPMEDMSGFQAHLAIPAIVQAAKSRRVLMLNESHVSQRHRAFAWQLAVALHRVGFTHFGAETFAPELARSMADGAPDGRTGVYTADPLYADLARQTLRLGYTLFDYEQRPDQVTSADADLQMAMREQAQAANIKRVLDRNPRARLFVYTGGSHMDEIPDGRGRAWMGLRLNRLTGIDALTIDQISGTPSVDPARETPRRHGVQAQFQPDSPIVLRDAGGGWLTRPGVDMTVFHPRTRYLDGRADWLRMGGYRKPVQVALAPAPERTLLRAFIDDEPDDAIAMDQMMVEPDAATITLMLPAGRYRLVRETLDGNLAPLGRCQVD